MSKSAFDVKSGVLNLNPRSTAPSSAKEGDYYHDDGSGANDAGLYQYINSVWTLVGSGGGGEGTPIFDIIEQFDAEDQDVTGFTNVTTTGTDPIAGTYSYSISTFPAEFPTVTLENRSKGKRCSVIGQASLTSGSCRMVVRDQTSAVLGSIFFNSTEVSQFRLSFDTETSTTSLTFEIEDNVSATGLKIDDVFFTDDLIKSATEFNEASEIFVSNFSSFAGSGANSIFRFSVLENSQGTDITYNATNGTYTVNSPGIYHMSGSATISAIGLSIAILANTTTFAYGPEMLAFMEASAAGDQVCVSTSKYLQAGDVIRLMQNANNSPGNADRARFMITKVGSSSVFNSQTNIGNSESVTVTGSWTTNTTYSAERRRIGDHYYYDILVSLAGAPNATALVVNLPSGDVIDTGKLTNPFANSAIYGAISRGLDNAVISVNGTVDWETTTSVRPRYFIVSGTLIVPGSYSNTAPWTFAAGDFVHLHFAVPIVGLSASTITGVEVTETTINLAGSGDFTGGTLKISRIGNMVTAQLTTAATHASLSQADSAAGLIPTWARPSITSYGSVISNPLIGLRVLTDGTFRLQYLNSSLAGVNATGAGGNLSYLV